MCEVELGSETKLTEAVRCSEMCRQWCDRGGWTLLKKYLLLLSLSGFIEQALHRPHFLFHILFLNKYNRKLQWKDQMTKSSSIQTHVQVGHKKCALNVVQKRFKMSAIPSLVVCKIPHWKQPKRAQSYHRHVRKIVEASLVPKGNKLFFLKKGIECSLLISRHILQWWVCSPMFKSEINRLWGNFFCNDLINLECSRFLTYPDGL